MYCPLSELAVRVWTTVAYFSVPHAASKTEWKPNNQHTGLLFQNITEIHFYPVVLQQQPHPPVYLHNMDTYYMGGVAAHA